MYYSDFSRALIRMIGHKGWTTAIAAQKCGCTYQSLHSWMHGTSIPSKEAVEKIVAAIGDEANGLESMINREVTKMKNALLKDVSIDEPKRMRDEEGLNMNQIAKRLNVSYMSVYRALNKVPKTVNTKPATPIVHRDIPPKFPQIASPVVPVVQPSRSISPMAVLNTHSVSELQGVSCVYKVDSDLSYVEIRSVNGGTLEGMVSYEDMPQLIKELTYLLTQRDK